MTDSAQTIGRYRVIKRLAVGGMGEINLAKQVGLRGFERVVILKTLLPELTQDESFLEQFLDEARVAATLNHPNIVAILELGQEGDRYFMAMEYIDGVDLGFAQRWAHKEKRPLTPRAVAGVIARAAVGLDHAHHANDSEGNPLAIVHRDVSPSNIMLRGDGVVKVVDFGIARAANQGHRTGANVVKGKLRYMSPEQVTSNPLDMRSDQFSLGVVLWELLVGAPLFRGDSPVDVMRAVLTSPIPKPSLVNAAVPAALDAIVLRMLERKPAARFARLLDVAEELQSVLDAHGGAADADLRDLGTWLVGVRGNPLDTQKPAKAGTGRSCHRCGGPLSANDKFCAECGTAVSSGGPIPARRSPSGEARAAAPVRVTPASAPAPISGIFSAPPSAPPETSNVFMTEQVARPFDAKDPRTVEGAALPEPVVEEPVSMELTLHPVPIEEPPAQAGAPRSTPAPGSALLSEMPAPAAARRITGVGSPAAPAPAPASPPRRITGVGSPAAPTPAVPAPGLGPAAKPTVPAALEAASSGERWLQLDDGAEAEEPLEASEQLAFSGLLLAARELKPLVGRTAEVQKIIKGIDHVKRGGFAGAVWVGPPGVGKTRLLEEAQVLAHTGGLMVVRVTGNRFGMPVTLDLVHQLLAGAWCALELGPGAGPPPLAGHPKGWVLSLARHGVPLPLLEQVQHLLMGTRPDDHADLTERRVEAEAALCQVFRALCGIRPMCVLVDDLRAAEPRSVELLEDVLNRTQALPMLLLAAGPPELEARLFPRLTRVPLGPLVESEAARLAQQLPQPPRGPAAVRALFQATGGSPGAMMLFDGSEAVRTSGRGTPVPVSPVRLEALQDALLARLPHELPSVLRAAAVLGPVFSTRWLEGCLAEVLPLGPLLQDAAQAGLLEGLDQNREHYLFSSQGFREGLLARLPVPELRALQLQVAQGLGRMDDQAPAAELRVRLLRQLSGQETDPAVLAAVARRQAGMGAFGTAADTYRRALNTESRRFTSPTPEDATRLLALAAEAVEAVATVDPGEATTLLGPVLDRVPPTMAVAARAEALRRRARVWTGAARFAEAESALTNALDLLGVAEPAQRSLVVAAQAAALEGRGDLKGALAALGAAAQLLPEPGMVPPWEEYGMFLSIAGLCEKLRMPEQASAALQACVDRAGGQGQHRWAARARVPLARILEKHGQIPQCARQLLLAQEEATACGDVLTVLAVLSEQARMHETAGRSAQASAAWKTVLEGALLAGRKELAQMAQQKLAARSA